ncbi:MAG: mechanosensitive ion channel family protein, partial [Methylococcales bacterium]|nr:mechanosensitive ion channel family protein [Methylococcales bacterium]
MNRHSLFLITALAALLPFFSGVNLQAQSTATNPDISYNDLALILEPLTAEDLEKEAKDWQALVKAQIGSTSSYLIQTRENSESKTIQTQLANMRENGNALVERFSLVLSELEQKGGDAKGYRDYIGGLPLLNVDTSDVRSFTPAITGWLTSQEGGMKWLKRTGVFIGVLLIFWILAGLIHRIVKHTLDSRKIASELIEDFIKSIVKRVVMLVGLITALAAVGVKVGALLA